MKLDKKDVLKTGAEILGKLVDNMGSLPDLPLSELVGKAGGAQNTVLIVVDMINGFARQGALKSDRVEALIPEIEKLSKMCDSLGVRKLAFADCHTEASMEFGAYPAHCLKGSPEGEMVDELKNIGGFLIIPKNSTNGFLEAEFQKWLKENSNVDNFIIVGDCTDICIEQFSVALKAYFNIHDRDSRIVVPVNAVDTYDLGLHKGDLMNLMAAFMMAGNGIELVSGIK
ncbi:MAG: cysteine hydrolase family protein [Caulobacteraceae bacterium]